MVIIKTRYIIASGLSPKATATLVSDAMKLGDLGWIKLTFHTWLHFSSRKK